jgi:hypothetical protein
MKNPEPPHSEQKHSEPPGSEKKHPEPPSSEKKHPVLRIKKGSVVYDDRNAQFASEIPRPALPGTRPLRSRRGRRRGGRLTFFPLLVIAAGLFIFFRIIPNAPVGKTVLSGWQVILRATPIQDRLIVGVTFISTAGSNNTAAQPAPGAPVQEADARITLPGTGEQVFVSGDLDKSPMTIRGDLPRISGVKRVQAEVSIGSAHASMWIPAPR